MSHNELPDIRSQNAGYSALPTRDATRSGRGCVLLTVPGCIISSCLGLVALSCMVVLAPIIGLGALAAALATNSVSETGTQTLRLEPSDAGHLVVDNTNIDVSLRPGTSRDISLEYELTANGLTAGQAQDALDNLTVVLARDPNGDIRLDVQEGDYWLNIYSLDASLTVPPEMASVDIQRGDDVDIQGISADFMIDVLSHDVTLRDVSGSFEVRTSGLGDIVFEGDFAPNSRNIFESGSGDIRLTLPADANVEYTALTGGTGDVTCPRMVNRSDCRGRLGDGSALLSIESDSGDITLATRR